MGERAEDAATIGQAAGRFVEPLYAFGPPVSPHRAAREASRVIDLPEVAAWVGRHAAPWTIVETAGGLLSPLDDDGRTNLDLCALLAPEVVLAVAADALGALHQVGSLMLALATRDLARRTVVVLSRTDPEAATLDNAGELRRLGVASAVVPVPPGGTPEAFADLRAALATPCFP